MTKVVTFYSYKGGVGRTMALVNAAHVLARDGLRVLMVDFDLEAPGMTHFFSGLVREQKKATAKDALDLLLEAKRTFSLRRPGKHTPAPISLSDYIVTVDLPDNWGKPKIPYLNGQLDLLPASFQLSTREGQTAPFGDYLARMDELDLTGMFERSGPRHYFSLHVRDYFVNARFWTKSNPIFTIRDRVHAAYDIVLIDSRTGFSEFSGFCMGPLADSLVILSGLNQQSLEGTRYIMQRSGLFEKGNAKPFVLVAGPVPLWQTKPAADRIRTMEESLQAANIITVPYHPLASMKETVFVREEPEDPISKAYEDLAHTVAASLLEGGVRRRLRDLVQRPHDVLQVGREIASFLPLTRLQPREWSPTGPFAFFPSAYTMAGLPARNAEISAGDADRVVLAAAVASYRLRTEIPFERAWKLIQALSAPAGIAFMQFRVLGSLPKSSQLRDTFTLMLRDVMRPESSAPSGSFRNVKAQMDTLTTALYLSQVKAEWTQLWSADALEARLVRLWEEIGDYIFHTYRSRILYRLVDVSSRFWGKEFAPILAAILHRRPQPKHKQALESFVQKMVPPLPFKEMRRLGLWPAHEAFFVMDVPEEFFFRNDEEPQPPLGFWPETAMISALALVKGADAIEDLMSWIMLARMTYGYAWRVLVDWGHLDSVRRHPLFVEFLRGEDEQVDAIEKQFDDGTYTL